MASAPGYFALLCPSFHGATMFSALLSAHSMICSAGDGNPRPRPGHRMPCKCGRRIDSCEFWIGLKALSDTHGGPHDGAWFATTPQIVARSAAANRLAVKALTAASYASGNDVMMRAFPRASAKFVEMVGAYASYCCDYHGKSVFFDGEKSFSKYCSLQACGFPIAGVVHLVRDARAFVASSKKRNVGVETASRAWLAIHKRLDDMASWRGRTRVFRLRYEDLVETPDKELEAIATFMGLAPERLTRPPELDRLHLIGNSLAGFDGVPRKGDGWQGKLTNGEVDTVVRHCGPLMRKLGYEVA